MKAMPWLYVLFSEKDKQFYLGQTERWLFGQFSSCREPHDLADAGLVSQLIPLILDATHNLIKGAGPRVKATPVGCGKPGLYRSR